MNSTLSIEIRGGHVWSQGKDSPFVPCPKGWEEELKECQLYLSRNPDLIYELNPSQQKNLRLVFQTYGQHLYFQIIPPSVRPRLIEFDRIELILEPSYSDLAFELLFDGDVFLGQKLAIVRILKGLKTISHRSIEASPPTPIQIWHSVLNAEGPTNIKYTHQITPWAFTSTNKFPYNGYFSFADWLKSAPIATEVLYLGLMVNSQGVYLPNETSSNTLIPWPNFWARVHQWCTQGLLGLFTHFWDVDYNMPYSIPAHHWQNSALQFGLELSGAIPQEIFRLYLSYFLDFFSQSHNINLAHHKSWAKISGQIPVQLEWSYFRAYERENVGVGLAKPIAKEQAPQAISTAPNSILPSVMPLRLLETSHSLQIARFFNQAKPAWGEIRTPDYQPIEDQIWAWLARDTSMQAGPIFPSLWNTDALNLVPWVVKPDNPTSLSFLLKMLDQFLLFPTADSINDNPELSKNYSPAIAHNPSLPSKPRTVMVLRGPLPKGEIFEKWWKAKEQQGYVLITANFSPNPSPLPLIIEWKTSTTEENPVWAAFGENNCEPLENKPLLLRLKQALKKKIPTDYWQLLALLYIVRNPYPIAYLNQWSKPLATEDWQILSRLNLVCISLDGANAQLNPSFLYWFDKEELWSKAELVEIAQQLMPKFLNEQWPTFSTKNAFSLVFVGHTNLAEFLAFQGDYSSALKLLLQTKRNLWTEPAFQPTQLFLWGMTSMGWLPHLLKQSFPKVGERIWRSFFVPSLETLPNPIHQSVIAWGIEIFTRHQVWGGYAYALASRAEFLPDSTGKKIFSNLCQEAFEIANEVSNLVFCDLFFQLLKAAAQKKDLGRYDELLNLGETHFKEKEKMAKLLAGLPAERKKDQHLLDLWSAVNENQPELAEKSFKAYNTSPIEYPSVFEKELLHTTAEWLRCKAENIWFLPLLERMLGLSVRLNDWKLKQYALEALLAANMEDIPKQIGAREALLKFAIDQVDTAKAKKMADALAGLYFKLGDTQATTYYYTLAESFRTPIA